jgi:hypothetical protein
MITGMSYAGIARWFAERMSGHDFATSGISYYPMDDFLVEHGYAVARRNAGFCNKLREHGWPPAPWADMHLCQVSNPGGAHYVVMLGDGTVLEPMSEAPTKLDAWGAEKVHQVAAVYRVRS